MSLNIYFEGQREIFVPKTGKKERKHISVWQTPTEITFKILKADDPIKAYFDWVLEISEEVSMPVYADDDLLQEKSPIGGRKIQSRKRTHKRTYRTLQSTT